MIYDKPFKTIEEQLQLLKNRNLIILDDDFARKALLTVSYYDLINGYQESMMDSGLFKQGVSLEYLFAFHLFDKDFQHVLFKNSVLIENIFKTKVSYVLSKDLGVEIDNYLDPREYLPRYKDLDFFKLQSEFYKIYMKYDRQNKTWIPKATDSIHQPTRHYFEHHNHIPPWIIMRNLSFSNAINLYRLIKTPHKEMISDLLLPNIRMTPTQKSNFLVPAISLIREFRNQVAHNLKFVNHISSNNRLPTSETNSITKNKAITSGGRALNDIYACLIATTILLDTKDLKLRFLEDIRDCILQPKQNTIDPKTKYRSQLFRDYLTVSNMPHNFWTILSQLIQNLPG